MYVMPDELSVPRVSKMSGWNKQQEGKGEYLVTLRSPENSATPPVTKSRAVNVRGGKRVDDMHIKCEAFALKPRDKSMAVGPLAERLRPDSSLRHRM